uniref:Uncharacterized protein n=1 Tax=Vitis vinifera TaxID=29760 RepID=F6I2T8_VITVI
MARRSPLIIIQSRRVRKSTEFLFVCVAAKFVERSYLNLTGEGLVFVYQESDEEEYNQFDEEFPQDKNLASTDCEEIIEEVAERIEKDLILLAATIVEDKLRNGVLECINKLAQAGRKLWVLTGDKTETAERILHYE